MIMGSACSPILLVLLVTLSGCIVTYRDFPNTTLESLPKDHVPKPLLYHVEPIITQSNHTTAEARERAKGSTTRFAAYMSTILTPGLYPYLSSSRSHRAAWVSRGGTYVEGQWAVL